MKSTPSQKYAKAIAPLRSIHNQLKYSWFLLKPKPVAVRSGFECLESRRQL
jgi:hypothetical protein